LCALRAVKSRGELEDLLAETACSEPHQPPTGASDLKKLAEELFYAAARVSSATSQRFMYVDSHGRGGDRRPLRRLEPRRARLRPRNRKVIVPMNRLP